MSYNFFGYSRTYYGLDGKKITRDNPPKCRYCNDQGYIEMGGPDFEVNPCPFCDALEKRREMSKDA